MKGRYFLWVPVILSILLKTEKALYNKLLLSDNLDGFIAINIIILILTSLFIEIKYSYMQIFDECSFDLSDFKGKPLRIFSIIYIIMFIIKNINKFLDKYISI